MHNAAAGKRDSAMFSVLRWLLWLVLDGACQKRWMVMTDKSKLASRPCRPARRTPACFVPEAIRCPWSCFSSCLSRMYLESGLACFFLVQSTSLPSSAAGESGGAGESGWASESVRETLLSPLDAASADLMRSLALRTSDRLLTQKT